MLSSPRQAQPETLNMSGLHEPFGLSVCLHLAITRFMYLYVFHLSCMIQVLNTIVILHIVRHLCSQKPPYTAAQLGESTFYLAWPSSLISSHQYKADGHISSQPPLECLTPKCPQCRTVTHLRSDTLLSHAFETHFSTL